MGRKTDRDASPVRDADLSSSEANSRRREHDEGHVAFGRGDVLGPDDAPDRCKLQARLTLSSGKGGDWSGHLWQRY